MVMPCSGNWWENRLKRLDGQNPELPHLNDVFPDDARRLRWLLLIICVLLITGMVSPIITLEKLIFIENTFSVVSGVIQLFGEGQYFLFLVISIFSIGLPLIKLVILYLLLSAATARRHRFDRLLELMHDYGKWSMLDVFVVAILVVAVKLGALADVQMRYGLYAFAAGVLLTMYVTARVVGLSDLVLQQTPGEEVEDAASSSSATSTGDTH